MTNPLPDKDNTEPDEILAVMAKDCERVHQARLRDLMAERLALKLTQADMAAIISVSRLTYIKWERNMSLMPIGRYKQICLELDRIKALTPDKENSDE